MNSVGKVVMESILETNATILQFIRRLRGNLLVTFEEGTWAAWLYDLPKPYVTKVTVCNPRKSALPKIWQQGRPLEIVASPTFCLGTPANHDPSNILLLQTAL